MFALPSIFLLPAAASGLGLSQAVAGAWIGGNIILAFVSIGLEFRVAPLREAGWRTVGVFAGATAVNLLVGLLLATLLFRGFPAA